MEDRLDHELSESQASKMSKILLLVRSSLDRMP